MSDQKKPTIRMPKYGKAKILKSFPSAWLTATNAYPDPRFDDEHRVREANRIIQWHRDNGSEDTLASTYRGDFYEPIKGSPEDGLYWGDFYEDPIDQMVEQEKAIALMTKQVEEANDAVKACGKALDTHYRKVKQTQYRWKTTLNKINDETREIAEWLDVNVPSSYLPVLNELITEGQSMIDDRGRPIRNRMYWDEPTIRDDVEKELMEQMSFRTVRQLIRRQDRLSAIQHQKSDISWKMQHQQEQTQKSEMNLMDHLNEAKRVRGDLAEKLDRMVSMRQALDITGLIKERQTDPTKGQAYIDELTKLDKANAELFDVSGVQGTMYSGKVTIPPHSSVEIPLGDMMANALTNAISKNTENHKQSQEMTFRTDMLQFAKFDKQKKQQIREQINTPILMNIASMLPAEMIDAFKGLPSSASRTLRHDMEKLEERQLRGKSSIECLAPPKVISGRQIEHARREIALRCGKWLPFSFLIDVVEHWRTNVYVCQVITNEFHLPCCLALGVDREGKFAGKLRVRTGFFLRPDIWTIGWEAENRRIDPGDQSFTVKQLIAEHNRLMGILPMPMQVTDILGITMNDPVTNIAFN